MNATVTVLNAAICAEAGHHKPATRHILTECPFATAEQIAEREAAHYDRVERVIRTSVDELNMLLGYGKGEGLTYGYIGNDDDVQNYVFLPHPGRVGTPDDRIGGFERDDWRGASSVAAQLRAMIRLTRNQAERAARA